MWADVYVCRRFGSRWTARGEKYVVGKFWNPAHAKEGFAISDCIDERHTRLLEFLIPILYPEKPTRVTVTIANTIFEAMEDRPVHWGKILGNVVSKLVAHLAKGKQSPISPYLFHLYHSKEILSAQEAVIYETGATILRFELTSELEKEVVEEAKEEV